MPRNRTGAERYFAGRARSPEFKREYDLARRRIDAVDRLIKELDEARESAGLSKAELARRASMTPEVVRRIFTAKRSNPTLDTLVRLAQAADVDLVVTRRSMERGKVGPRTERAIARRSASA